MLSLYLFMLGVSSFCISAQSTGQNASFPTADSFIMPPQSEYANHSFPSSLDRWLNRFIMTVSSNPVGSDGVRSLRNASLISSDGSASPISVTESAVHVMRDIFNSTDSPPMSVTSFARPKEVLMACLFIETNSNHSLYYDYQKSAAAIDLAVDYVNSNVLPSNMTLITIYRDIGNTCVRRNQVASHLLKLIMEENYRCNVIIGPGCGYSMESVTSVSDFWRIPTIGCPAAGVGTETFIGDYTYLTRISFTHINTARRMLRFLRAHNYTSLTILQDQLNSFYSELSTVMESVLSNRPENSEIYADSTLIPFSSEDVTDCFLRDTLSHAVQDSRVFVLLTDADTVRKILIIAYELGMTDGSYVYCAVDLFTSTSWGIFTPFQNDAYDEEAAAGFATLFVLSLTTSVTEAQEVFSYQVKRISAEKYNYTYGPEEEVDVVVGHFYDAVIYYASLINDTVTAGLDHTDPDVILNLAVNYSFYSPLTGIVLMDENGDRQSSYILKNFNPATRRFEDFLSLPGDSEAVLPLGPLVWPHSTILPPNRPRCGYLSEDIKCRTHMSRGALASAVLLPLLIVTAILWPLITLANRYIIKETNPFWWRIFLSSIVIVNRHKPNLSYAAGSAVGKSKKSLATETSSVMSGKQVLSRDIPTMEAIYNGNASDLRALDRPYHRAMPTMRPIFDAIRRMLHTNLQIFYGIVVDEEQFCQFVLGERCSKGTLMHLLQKVRFNLDWEFKCSLLKDLASGMQYIHASLIYSHGNLTAYTCRIDSNFVLKITDYGMHTFHKSDNFHPPSEFDEDRDYELLLWRAPELLRRICPSQGTQKGDVYSFAIILQQIILRSPPFRSNQMDHRLGGDILTDQELVLEVKKGTNPPLRPRVPVSSCTRELRDLLETCWNETPVLRPSFSKIRESLLKQLGKAGDSIIEHLIVSMESHAADLELEAEIKMKMLLEEKKRSDDILSQMLPKSVAEALTHGQHLEPETFSSTTIYFSTIVGFMELIAGARTPQETMYILNTLYSASDAVVEEYPVYKVETINDSYMVVSGLPILNGIRHAEHIALMALHLRRQISTVVIGSYDKETHLKLRVGIHSGPCVAGIIGTKMPRYCLFGDTVNTGSRMESHGEAGKIQCSYSSKDLLDQIGGFILMVRGQIDIKGKGPMETFWLIAIDS